MNSYFKVSMFAVYSFFSIPFTFTDMKGLFHHWKSWRRLANNNITFVRYLGQPASQTHPFLMGEGEVTPGINKSEFKQRRKNLVKLGVQSYKGFKSVKDHLFILPSASVTYMTGDIPYVFRQNSDFLYFCGFQEPDSILVIEAGSDFLLTGKHKSTLFVPAKDPHRELWDGPRSGAEGALSLTGVDTAFDSREFEKYLNYYNSEHKDYIVWYQHSQPVNTSLHQKVTGRLANGSSKRYRKVENIGGLAHSLRVMKSPAELELMQRSIDIASASFKEVMKFSKPMVSVLILSIRINDLF